jgi:hypothetical protein
MERVAAGPVAALTEAMGHSKTAAAQALVEAGGFGTEAE